MIKPLTAFCIVKRKNPKINVLELYDDPDVRIDKKTEKLIRVKITELKK